MFLRVKCPLFLYQNKFFITHFDEIQNEIELQLHQSFEGEST